MNKIRNINAVHFSQQPLWFNGLNKAWKFTYPMGTRSSLEKDSLIKAARKATGLNDFGGSYWEEPLDKMLESIKHEAQLHPVGQFITRQRLVQLLNVRLRTEYWFKKHPEILDQPLYPVMLVLGLQRTGTTKLQRLLAADPDNRAVLSWEALNPAPLNGDIKSGKDRIKVARTSEKALKIMSPGFFAIHPVEHQAPEEDVLLLDASFLSTTAEATMHVPSYSSWLETTDQSEAYDYMAKLMKLLQWQRPASRWVLKTPHHLEFLDLAKKYFDPVQFIWTHRELYECIPSFLSMVSYARILFSDQVTQEMVTRHWLNKIGTMLSKATEYHNSKNNGKDFIHIRYEQLVDDPMEVLCQIYKQREEPFESGLKNIFEQAEKNNPKGKYGNHKYSLADFGLDEKKIDQFTEGYQQFYKKLLFSKQDLCA